MRDYGRVHGTFWSSPTTSSMNDKAKMLALYLMTTVHGTIAGVFRLPDGYIAEDLQWTVEDVRQAFGQLLDKGFANRCETTKWVWVKKHLEWNPPENPNQRKSVHKVAATVPGACTWRADFLHACGAVLGMPQEQDMPAQPLANPFTTFSQPVTVTTAVAVAAPVTAAVATAVAIETSIAAVKTPKFNDNYSAEFEEAWASYPKRPGHSKAEAHRCWTARVAAGEDMGAMLNGTRRYAVYCKVTGAEPQYIKHGSTFYGPDRHYLNDWTAPAHAPAGPVRGGRVMTQEQRAAAGDASTVEAAKLLGFGLAANTGEVLNATM